MTPRIKKAYRHFNAFLAQHSCKQKFWRNIQKKANYAGLPYHTMKTKLLVCNRPQEWILNAFRWTSYPLDKTNLSWCDLSRFWDEYCHNHKYFV